MYDPRGGHGRVSYAVVRTCGVRGPQRPEDALSALSGRFPHNRRPPGEPPVPVDRRGVRAYLPRVRRRLRMVAISLFVVWGPFGVASPFGLATLAGDAHYLTLQSPGDGADLVLHHHPVPSIAEGAVLEANDHPHGDHIVVGPGIGAPAASRVSLGALPSQACLQGDVGSGAVACARSLRCIATRSTIGDSPPSVHTVTVLQI